MPNAVDNVPYQDEAIPKDIQDNPTALDIQIPNIRLIQKSKAPLALSSYPPIYPITRIYDVVVGLHLCHRSGGRAGIEYGSIGLGGCQ